MYYYIICSRIPQYVVFMHQFFRISSLNPQYSQKTYSSATLPVLIITVTDVLAKCYHTSATCGMLVQQLRLWGGLNCEMACLQLLVALSCNILLAFDFNK